METVKIESKPKKNETIFQKINLSKKGFRILIVFMLIAALSIAAYFLDLFSFLRVHEKLNSDFILVSASSDFEKSFRTNFKLPEPPQIKDKENPINGNMVTRKKLTEMQARKAIAVTINNHQDARPQFGLSQADIVMEVLAEGGITRYVPIFYENQDLAKIGPVRSVRLYMIEFIQGFDDPVLMHEGQAGYDGAPFETYNPRSDARGYMIKNGIKSLQSAGSRYRDLERAKLKGYVHSLFTNGELLKKEVDRYGWTLPSKIEPLKFKLDAPFEERGNFVSVDTTFIGLDSASYKSGFTYDKNTNTYPRIIAGKPDVDALTNQQISPKNVIIEWHNYANANDGHSHLVIDMVGEDEVKILRDGQVINGKWKKTCAECRAHYFDSEGNEIELNRGQIWVVNVIKTKAGKVSKVEIK